MAAEHHIRNPFEFGIEQVAAAVSAAGGAMASHRPVMAHTRPAIRRITTRDLRDALAGAIGDLGAGRTDILFIALIYPIAGLILARLAYGHSLLPLVFPLASGFALIGPLAAVGVYEVSLRREQGAAASWGDVLGVVRSPGFGAIVELGLVLVALFLLWLAAAYGVFLATLGPQPPASLGAFAHDVFETAPGWAMIVVGIGVGFGFAVVALAISVVSFPLLVDRPVGVGEAISTSVRAVIANPAPMALWGLIVAGSLVLGSLPALVGLVVVMPVLGHATWRLYRKLVAPA